MKKIAKGTMEHEHSWSPWQHYSQYVEYEDGMYNEEWEQRYCYICGATESTNYSRVKVYKNDV